MREHCYMIYDRKGKFLWISEMKPETSAAVRLCGNSNGLWWRWMDRAFKGTTWDYPEHAAETITRLGWSAEKYDVIPVRLPVTIYSGPDMGIVNGLTPGARGFED